MKFVLLLIAKYIIILSFLVSFIMVIFELLTLINFNDRFDFTYSVIMWISFILYLFTYKKIEKEITYNKVKYRLKKIKQKNLLTPSDIRFEAMYEQLLEEYEQSKSE